MSTESQNATGGDTSYEAGNIQVLEGLEAVRKRPGMYIGSTGPRGLHHLVYEIVDNSVDEALAGHCDTIEVTITKDGWIRCKDNGRGIPVSIHPTEGISTVQVVLTILHAGGKFGGGGYAVSGGLHGVGASVVNALSTKLKVQVAREGFLWNQSYQIGVPDAPLAKGEPADYTGTTIEFLASPEIFETVEYDYETLRQRFQQMCFLNKGLKISLADERNGRQDTYFYENGLRDYVEYLNVSKKSEIVNEEIISFESETKEKNMSVEIAMQWTNAYNESVHTYANTINTHEGGTHEEGFRAALTTLLNKYAREKGLLKEKDENLSGDDCREGLTCVISVKLAEPQFEGQTKTKLGNTEAKAFVQRVVNEEFGDWLGRNPNVAKDIIRKAIQAATARQAARKAREATRRKGLLESGGRPGKLREYEPVASTTCFPMISSAPTVTVFGAVSLPNPSMTVTPRALRRPCKPLYFLEIMPSRYALTARISIPLRVLWTPYSEPSRATSATSATCNIAFVGTHPRCKQVPPSLSFSITAAVMPSSTARMAVE